MSLSVDILRGVAKALREKASDFLYDSEEYNTYEDAADAVLDAADLTENLDA